MTRPPSPGRADRGSATVEAALLAPGLLLLIGLTVLGGRTALAGGAVEQAAAAAARQASLARSPGPARSAAAAIADRTLAEQHLHCGHTVVSVDTSGFGVPTGQPAQVRVQVTCAVRLSDLALPGLPGTRRLRATAVSPLDPYRARSG
jgi:Flp pilus assembly protein TadG